MAENTIVVGGKIYAVPKDWDSRKGIPIFEYVGEQVANQTTTGGSIPWLWIGIGAAVLFVMSKK